MMSNTSQKLGRSKEDYLEAILAVTKEKGACRMTDIARHLNYSKPSVSNAMKKLEEEGYVERNDWRILLTEEGYKIAEGTLEKHEFFCHMLEQVGVDPVTAEKEACLMEHAISRSSFQKIRAYWEKMNGQELSSVEKEP